MDFWRYFWVIAFVVSGAAFTAIAIVVSIRGVGDLRDMLAALRRREDSRQ